MGQYACFASLLGNYSPLMCSRSDDSSTLSERFYCFHLLLITIVRSPLRFCIALCVLSLVLLVLFANEHARFRAACAPRRETAREFRTRARVCHF
jgi:hypothetical protein